MSSHQGSSSFRLVGPPETMDGVSEVNKVGKVCLHGRAKLVGTVGFAFLAILSDSCHGGEAFRLSSRSLMRVIGFASIHIHHRCTTPSDTTKESGFDPFPLVYTPRRRSGRYTGMTKHRQDSSPTTARVHPFAYQFQFLFPARLSKCIC